MPRRAVQYDDTCDGLWGHEKGGLTDVKIAIQEDGERECRVRLCPACVRVVRRLARRGEPGRAVPSPASPRPTGVMRLALHIDPEDFPKP